MTDYKTFSTIQDSNVATYTAHKNWSFTSQSFTDSKFKYLRGIYSDKYVTISASSAAGELQNSDGSYMKNTYIGINHLYYSFYSNFGYISYPIESFARNLNKELITYSVPRIKVGDEIKPGSVSLTVTGRLNETITLQDNGNYELIDTRINTSSFAPGSLIYLGFNNGFDSSYIPDNYYSKDISYTTGINSSNYTHGYQANFNGSSSYIQVKDDLDNWFNTFDNDFAISFWIFPRDFTSTNQTVISKKWLNGALLKSYPFDIIFNGTTSNLIFTRTDINSTSTITISLSHIISSNSPGFIIFQKAGEHLDVTLQVPSGISVFDTVTDITTEKVSNKSSIYLGSSNTAGLTPFSGSLDEVRFYSRALTLSEITSLSTLNDIDYSALQTNKVGNVFYDQGMAIYSPYQNELVSASFAKDFTLSYKSSLDIEQSKYYINVPMNDFNTSTNPSLYDITGSLASFATGSDFNPYITTIGLYDTNYNLVAVAKLGAPIPKRNDIDLNFEVRFDKS
jgi:hypothetical protein